MPTLFRQFHGGRNREPKPLGASAKRLGKGRRGSSGRGGKQGSFSSTSLARVEARREFVRTTSMATQDESYTNPESLPSVEVAYNMFQRIYPKFAETWAVDDLRDREYFHLEECQHVCMDYCGLGLFSYYQQVVDKATSSFGLAYLSANLPTHALYGAPEEGTTEFYVRKRVMEFLNINESEYSMVFTASRGSAFRLLAESYPFHINPKLLTVYDFESEAVNWMGECAKQRGAKIMSACFKWPSLRIGTTHLKKLLQEKKKRSEHAKGLFVFPVQSRMTGAKYSYQWMSQAQQNKWHVLLDASAMGPKDMDSLGLSLFRPDFIISSFYKVFGSDPTGFGCLFIKNTAIRSLHNSARARAVGVMRIVSMHSQFADGHHERDSEDDDDEEFSNHAWGLRPGNFHAASSFSGPYLTGLEPELETEARPKKTGRRSWRSWRSSKKNGKLISRDISHSGVLSESDIHSMRDVSQYLGEPSELEYEPQMSESQFYAEKLEDSDFDDDEDSEIRDNWEHSLYLNGDTVDEIENLDHLDESLSDDGDDLDDPQWSGGGLLSDIEEEEIPSLLQSFSGQPISPIIEEEAEGLETEEESAAQTPVRDGNPELRPGVYSAVHPDVHPEEEESEDDGVYLETHSTRFSTESEAEFVEALETMRWNSSSDDEEFQQRGSLIGRKFDGEDGLANASRNVEVPQSKDVPVVPVVEEQFNGTTGEEADNSKRNNANGQQEAHKGSQTSAESSDQAVQERVTGGEDSSDYQAVGVRGLVRKFQSFRSGSLSRKDAEGAVEGNSNDRGTTSNGERPAPAVGNNGKMIADDGEGDRNFVSRGAAYNMHPRNGIDRSAGETNRPEQWEAEAGDGPSLHEDTRTDIHDPRSGEKRSNGGVKSSIPSTVGPRKSPDSLPGKTPSSKFTETDDTIEPSPRRDGTLDARLDQDDATATRSGRLRPSETRLAEIVNSRKVRFSDRDEYSGELDVDHSASSTNVSRSPRKLLPSRSDGREPFEEENYGTIHPAGSRVKESTVESDASEGELYDSQELSDQEPTSAIDRDPLQMNEMPERIHDDFVQNEVRQRQYGKDGRLFRQSPSLESDASASTPLHHMATPRRYDNYSLGSGREDRFDDSSEYNGAKDLRSGSLANGRFDLRDNITLSRDVNFEDDELYSERSSNASDLLASRRFSMTMAEDFTEIDMQNSDDDSLLQSVYENGISRESSAPRYMANEMPAVSYRTGDDEDAEERYEENLDDKLWEGEVDPFISCRGLDFADTLGLTKLNHRLRYLINWLVSSLLKLRHPGPNQGTPMVRVYGPKVKYDRGAAVSFNMFDWKGQLIQPGVVQRLADRSNIALGVGRLCNIVDPESFPDFAAEKERLLEEDDMDQGIPDSFPHSGKLDGGKSPLKIPVVTAALGFVTTFEDVYKLWSFLAKFLDADFVSKEVWRYRSLDQQTVLM